MPNKTVFQTDRGRLAPQADTENAAGSAAYSLEAKQALAQLAVTGCFNDTYYTKADEQLARVTELADQVEPEFIAKVAVYARETGKMKDMPAFLAAVLAGRDVALLDRVFSRVITNGRMLRNFVQIIRSGAVGRKSFGSGPKRLIRGFLRDRHSRALFNDAVGNDPSLSDIIKMVHPRPANPEQEALFGYIIGAAHNEEVLPDFVKQYEAFKADRSEPVPRVDFRMLTALDLTSDHWKQIARTAPWQMTRMNLNTFQRHGVFEDAELTRVIAERLADAEAIVKSNVMPYQLLVAYRNTQNVPRLVLDSLQDAMEVATQNVPALAGKTVYIFPDCSGSMNNRITGTRDHKDARSNTNVRNTDVAALITASLLRKNPYAEVIPFGDSLAPNLNLNPRDSVMTLATTLSQVRLGGTYCSLPLKYVNDRNSRGDVVIYISDYESNIGDSKNAYHRRTREANATTTEWQRFKARNPHAKLVCIDVSPPGTVQAPETVDTINIAGFNDGMFRVIERFVMRGQASFVQEIEQIEL